MLKQLKKILLATTLVTLVGTVSAIGPVPSMPMPFPRHLNMACVSDTAAEYPPAYPWWWL